MTDHSTSHAAAIVPSVVKESAEPPREIHVEGWSLLVPVGEDEPRVRDIDLAVRLGYERPRAVRDLIERLAREKKLNDSELRRTVRQTAGRPSTEIWLTEAQALKVVAKSETAVADALLDEVIRVFMLARRGLLPQAAPPAPVASPDALAVLERVAAQMEALNARLEAVERRPSNANGPSLGAGAARIHVLGPLRDIARIEASAMKRADKHAVMSLRTIAENQLRDRVDFPRYGGQSWAAFPENRLGELHAALARLLHDARKRAGVAAGKPTQMNLLPSAAKPRSPSA